MKIYRVRPNTHAYPYLSTAPGQNLEAHDLVFDGRSRAWSWSPMHAGFRPFGKEPADFSKLGHGGLVVSPRAKKLTQHLLERCGELLSVHVDDKEYFLLNITQVADCLNTETTQWFEVQGKPVHVKKYQFLQNEVPAVSLFKIPEQARDRFFTVTGRATAATEFKSIVEGAGLTGLVFEEVWDSEGSSCSNDDSTS